MGDLSAQGLCPRPAAEVPVDDGTSDATWLLATGWDDVPRLDLPAVVADCTRVVVVVPHPGDEIVALGATLADLSAQGVEVDVVYVHGTADAGVSTLGDQVSAVWLALPEGGSATTRTRLCDQLLGLLDARTVVFAPAECDGRPDTESAARIAQDAARTRSAVLLNYPVWLWHSATPADLDWHRVRTVSTSLTALHAKASAVDAFAGRAPDADVRRARTFETVLVPAAPDLAARVRDDVVTGRPAGVVDDGVGSPQAEIADAWLLRDLVYDRRRLGLILACLGRERYQSILEIGCGTGELSEELTGRANEVVAVDASALALQAARDRTDAVQWIRGAAPAELPDRTFDAIILSEIGYLLDGPDLAATLRYARRHLSRHGEIVLAHWRGTASGALLDGQTVHAQAAMMLDLPLRARYEDADVVVEVWGEPISVYREYRGAS